LIRKCTASDNDVIFSIINDAAAAYKGVIPAGCWHEPYMSKEQLLAEIGAGVEFYAYEDNGNISGVMGIQYFPEVTLIRHAYVRTAMQGAGIGGKLLKFLREKTDKPILIGTWRDTAWSIYFYKKHGFRVLTKPETDTLLSSGYWKITDAHREASVVLADDKWKAGSAKLGS
jgi:N-acetylglutamate synthase-like GNAT family acetyltransferase